jgi:trk system potassium uptake protein TrkH
MPLMIGKFDFAVILPPMAYIIPFTILFHAIINFRLDQKLDVFLRRHVFSVIVVVPLFIAWGDREFAFWLSAAHLFSSIMAIYDRPIHENISFQAKPSKKIWDVIRLSPAQAVLLSFVAVIALGTFLLKLPVSAVEGKNIKLIDALFMATSATSVTGLSTVSVGNDMTIFGQLVTLALIQIGGIGIMTLTSCMTIILGKAMGMKDRVVMQDLLEVSSLEDLVAMIIDIIKYTLAIELWGTILLAIAFSFEGQDLGPALYSGFFHAISAFCNAGLAFFDNSFESFSTNPLINFTIMALITLGGLGFIVLKELREVMGGRRSWTRLTLHTKIVLITSAILLFGGAIFIFFSEFLHALDKYTLFDKIQVSFFQSVTARTAGFNTIPMAGLNNYTLYGIIILMFIGASPGSTGGGIKTTTFAILSQTIIATLRGQKNVVMIDRTIPPELVIRTIALTFISIIIQGGALLVMMAIEKEQSFFPILFEVVSASGTVGLTMGLTTQLTAMGKFGILLLMFIGRVGPLTMVLALAARPHGRGKLEYPDGRILIG